MNTLASQRSDDAWSSTVEQEPIPVRPRRQLLNRRSAALLALLTAAAGFYAGVALEKRQVTSSSPTASAASPAGLAAGLQARFGAAGGGARGATGGPGAAAGAGATGGQASVGTISSVSGRTLYVSGVSGNTIKVKLTGATKITKSLGVKRSALRPGDTIIVRGLTGSNGTVTAATVSDSAGTAGAGSVTATGGAAGGSAGGSAVGSLFSNRGASSAAGG